MQRRSSNHHVTVEEMLHDEGRWKTIGTNGSRNRPPLSRLAVEVSHVFTTIT